MRLLYVVTEDWYFLSHRLPMARAARAAGLEVHVATRVSAGADAIEAEGFILHSVPFVRGRLSPLAAITTLRALRRVHRLVAPEISHHVALQASILGSLAAPGNTTSCVNAVTGLGYTFTSGNIKALLLRSLMAPLIRMLLNRNGCVALVQNPDDHAALTSLGVVPNQIALIPGSGVDVGVLQPLPEPPGPPTIAFVGRLLDDKGIRTLVRAHRLLRGRSSQVQLLIAGTPDPANPASISEPEAQGWNREPGIQWLGHVEDIASFWARAHIAVLPSRREGLPKSLVEAAACGRPLIAADAPGCREVVRHGVTGLLVPVDDVPALADAIEKLAADPALRERYGKEARRLAVERLSADAIGLQTVELYRRLRDWDRDS